MTYAEITQRLNDAESQRNNFRAQAEEAKRLEYIMEGRASVYREMLSSVRSEAAASEQNPQPSS